MAADRPPGPQTRWWGLPLVGEIKRDVLGFYERLRRDYGDVVYMRIGPYHEYSIFHPDAIRELLVTQARHFVRMKRPLEVLRQWNGDGLLITEGDLWRRHRRLVTPAFQPSRLGKYVPSLVESGYELLDEWNAEMSGGLSHTPYGSSTPSASIEVEFESAMTRLTMEFTGRTLFGTSLGDRTKDISWAVKTLSKVAVDEMFAPFTWPDWLPLPGKADKLRAMRLLDELVRGFIRQRRSEQAAGEDLLSKLLSAVDDEGDGRGLTDEQARDQCVTFFLAGHDTTAAALTWIGWTLATQQDAQRRAAAEVQEVLAGRSPTPGDLPRLVYVSRVVKETLRRYPPAVGVLGRQAIEDVEIGGWRIPRGGVCRVMTYVVHHDERWWPDPQQFDPDRFAPGREEQIPTGAYLPFGLGPRSCIGAGLASQEMVLFAAQLLQRFELSPAAGQSEPTLDPSMSLRPVGGLRLNLRPRR